MFNEMSLFCNEGRTTCVSFPVINIKDTFIFVKSYLKHGIHVFVFKIVFEQGSTKIFPLTYCRKRTVCPKHFLSGRRWSGLRLLRSMVENLISGGGLLVPLHLRMFPWQPQGVFSDSKLNLHDVSYFTKVAIKVFTFKLL